MNILIVSADFYQDIAAMLEAGAIDALGQAGANHELLRVPGALEIPPAIAMAAATAEYDGYIALGCVIRGETTHYETVCNESARGLMELGIQDLLAIGNGILTVESYEQALVRADKHQKNKGAGAAEACLRLVALSQRFMPEPA
jgi:6,7-dimethyl-8-ribityllumazine synthase